MVDKHLCSRINVKDWYRIARIRVHWWNTMKRKGDFSMLEWHGQAKSLLCRGERYHVLCVYFLVPHSMQSPFRWSSDFYFSSEGWEICRDWAFSFSTRNPRAVLHRWKTRRRFKWGQETSWLLLAICFDPPSPIPPPANVSWDGEENFW